MKHQHKQITAIVIFSVAMAALESAVVVYLRALFYADGFTVAFRMIDEKILLIELVREVATLVMLTSIAYLTGKSSKERFAFFLISFATWDIFYYVWLKVFINWPLSLLDWDILFLIPFTWIGPVLAPVLCSITMIIIATMLLTSDKMQITKTIWGLLIGGSVLILFTFLQDYGTMLLSNNFLSDYSSLLHNKKFVDIASSYVPEQYNWPMFCLGELMFVVAIIKLRQVNKLTNSIRVDN